MASVTVARVAAVQADVLDAVLKTSADSKLPVPEQDRLLAQSCTEACDLLLDWLASGWFERTRPKRDRLLSASVPTPAQFAEFLGPVFTDALQRIGQYGIDIDLAQLEQARAGVAALARRNRQFTRDELYGTAQLRVQSLQSQVCLAAGRIQKSAPAFRHRARQELKKVPALLGTVALGAVLSVGPHQLEQNVSEWVREAAQVVVVYHLAELAEPTAQLSAPEAAIEAEADEPEAEAGF